MCSAGVMLASIPGLSSSNCLGLVKEARVMCAVHAGVVCRVLELRVQCWSYVYSAGVLELCVQCWSYVCSAGVLELCVQCWSYVCSAGVMCTVLELCVQNQL